MKIYKLNMILIIIFSLVIPILFYVNYNSSYHKLYEKKYYLVKEGSPSFIKLIAKDNRPIINLDTIRDFVKKSIINIFTYKTVNAEIVLEENKILFKNEEYESFKEIFLYIAQTELENGAIIKEAYVDNVYYMGKFKFLDNKFYFAGTVRFRVEGESGKIVFPTKRFKMIVAEDDFEKNKTGLSIESIEIR